MAKKKKRKDKRAIAEGITIHNPRSSSNNKNNNSSLNPLLDIQLSFLRSLSMTERHHFFSNTAVSPDRRAALWTTQADLNTVDRFAWATPDDRALRIIAHFAPLVEIGCGANAYWCRLLLSQQQQSGSSGCVDVIGYDVHTETGGRIDSKTRAGDSDDSDGLVRHGGPEVLEQHSDRTLFLCYPDDCKYTREEDDDNDEHGPSSMAAACLEHYSGSHVIHVGELFADGTLSVDQAPWGRSSSAEFQERLGAEFHCLLAVELPNWLHTVDRLTVWKRSETCSIVFAGDEDDENDKDEEVEYRHIPPEEQLPRDMAAPCLQHLLSYCTAAQREEKYDTFNVKGSKATVQLQGREEKKTKATAEASPSNTMPSSRKQKKRRKEKETKSSQNKSEDYVSPW